MAKLSARGRTMVGEIKGATWTKRYMTDGSVLKNSGFGWKVYSHIKAGFTPQQVFERAVQKQAEHLAQHPAFAAYRKALINAVGLKHRWKLQCAISTMPDDCDGVWSEVCDGYGDNAHLDVSEVHELCELFKLAVNEKEANGQ